MEDMERRLKADVLAEAAQWDGHILVSEENDDMQARAAAGCTGQCGLHNRLLISPPGSPASMPSRWHACVVAGTILPVAVANACAGGGRVGAGDRG